MQPTVNRVMHGDNPFEVSPELDSFQGPRTDVPRWNETFFFSTWSPTTEAGVFVHTGADAADPELFYAQLIVYLPGGELVVERIWDRPTPPDLHVGPFSITTKEPLRRWRLQYDGAGERTTSERAGSQPIGAGLAVPLRLDIDFVAAGPIWDMFKAGQIRHSDWSGMHHEQITRATGTITVADKIYEIDGCGFRDHSTGPRDFSTIGGDRFWGLVSPTTGRGFQGLTAWKRTGELEICSAAYTIDDTFEIINGSIELTGATDTRGNPKALDLSFTRPNGEYLQASGRILHTVTITIADPNHNINGALLDGDPLILSESQVRFDWPDGDTFYGHLERGARLTDLQIP